MGVPQPLIIQICIEDRKPMGRENREKQNVFPYAKVSDKVIFYLPICLIYAQNISYENLG